MNENATEGLRQLSAEYYNSGDRATSDLLDGFADAWEADRRSQHLPVCNIGLGPIGTPGCICEVVSKHELATLRKRLEELRGLAAYGENVLRREYEDEAGIERVLSMTRRVPSRHRAFDVFKADRLATLAEKEKP